MNEAETRAELIDPAPKAAGGGAVPASPVRRHAITLGRQQSPSRPSGHTHRPVIIGYPTRNICRLIEDVGNHRRRSGVPGEPIAMQLDPAKPIPRQRRIGSRMCQPGTRTGGNPRHCRVVCLNQPPGGLWPRGPVRRGLKIAPDHAQILRPGGVGDQDRQRRSCRLRALPARGAGAGLLIRLKHAPSLALRGTGIANTAFLQVADAGVQPIGQRPWHLPADLLVHSSRHPRYLASAGYHIQWPVRNNRFARLPPPEIPA